MPLTYKKTKRILWDYNFVLDRQRGSHQQRKLNNKISTVPVHKEFPVKTAKSVLSQIAEAAWVEYAELMKNYNIKL